MWCGQGSIQVPAKYRLLIRRSRQNISVKGVANENLVPATAAYLDSEYYHLKDSTKYIIKINLRESVEGVPSDPAAEINEPWGYTKGVGYLDCDYPSDYQLLKEKSAPQI